MRRALPLLVALGLVAAVVVPYLALGGGSYEPTPVADPCQARPAEAQNGLSEGLERIALSAVDHVACEVGVSREELVLALRSEKSFDAFVAEHGLEQAKVEQALRDGLVQAVDEAADNGTLPSLAAGFVRKIVRTIPPWLLLDTIEQIGGFLS